MTTDAQCWCIPAGEDGPAFVVVQDRRKGTYVVGDDGPRPLTESEERRWLEFKAYLRRRT